MAELQLPLQMPVVEEGFCNTLGPDWVQTILNLVAQGVAILGTGSTSGNIILDQESVPGIDQQDFLWFRPSTGRIYKFDAGAWISPNPVPAGGIERQWVEGTPAQIWSMDGGDGSDPSITPPATNVGAMWEIDANYAGRSPMGVGAIPASFPAKNLSLSENFGEGAHTGVLTEMVPHNHPPADGFDAFLGIVSAGQPSTKEITSGTEVENMLLTGNTGGNGSGAADPSNITHPVRGGYMAKRTARVNYVAN